MTRFSARNESGGVVATDRDKVWAVLTDPGLIARMTPFLERIDVDGDHWRWTMSRIPGLGVSLAPAFTERMTFEPTTRIEFAHDPPTGEDEKAGVDGWYRLEDVEGGTHLAISLDISVDLPLSRLARPAVTQVMKGVIAQMGRTFEANLLRELGTTTVR